MNDIEKVIEDLKQLKHCLTNKCDETCTYYTDLFDDCNCNYDVSSDVTIDNAIQTIRELQEQIPKWHFVADGDLPTKEQYIANNGLFIVTDSQRVYSEWFDIFETKSFGKDAITHFIKDRNVIAWMELPKFKSEEKSNGRI